MSIKKIGFHGTGASVAKSIIKEGFKFSNDDNWFGEGVYFFCDINPITDGFVEARQWAQIVRKNSDWAILKSEIESNKVANLIDDIGLKVKFDKIREELLRIHKKSGMPSSSFSDKIVFKKIQEYGHFDYIIALVDAGRPQDYQTFYIRRLQAQLCVKTVTCIKTTSLIKTGKKNVLR